MPFWSRDKLNIFSMTPHGMLCFPNVFKISVANKKIDKTDSILILNNNIHEISRINPISRVSPLSPTMF